MLYEPSTVAIITDALTEALLVTENEMVPLAAADTFMLLVSGVALMTDTDGPT